MSLGDTSGCVFVQHRYRRLVQPAQFGGRRCAGHLWDEQACRAETTCTGPPGCGQDFQCEGTGECEQGTNPWQRGLGPGGISPLPWAAGGWTSTKESKKVPLFSVFPPTCTEIHPRHTRIWVEKEAVWHGKCEFFSGTKREGMFCSNCCAARSRSPPRAQRSRKAPLSPLLETEFNHQSNQQSVGVI